MRAVLTEPFTETLLESPPEIQQAFGKQLINLLRNLQHPSLHAHKYPQLGPDVWQARVTQSWRFYFRIESDTYILLTIIPHPK